jgi:hypothetical protein
MAECVLLMFIGFALGYGIRELISRSRRAAVRRFRESERLRQHPLAAETAGTVVTIFPPARHHRAPSMLRLEE